ALGYDQATGTWITRPEDLENPDDVADVPLRYAVFDLDGSVLDTEGGMIHGLLASRDDICAGQAETLDTLVSNLIFEMNKLHSEGCGLEFFDEVRSLESVDDPDAVLNDAGLHWNPTNGSFNIRVHDVNTGQVKTVNIQVDLDGIGTDDSLNSLAGKINTAMTAAGLGVAASVNGDNTLSIASSADDTRFTFSDDTSDVLAVLGINTFFTGHDAANVGVSAAVRNNINLVAAGLSPVPDDGSNAARIIDLRTVPLKALGGLSLEEFYQACISKLAIDASITASRSDGAAAYRDSLLSERESISGVNIDEEAMNMMRYQRAFQAAARYVNVIDELLQTMLALV
ncbi:MAG TPA: flagellar basal body rod C-terminal domain-containing protein, partial [Planctomycetota bacterium]|nr:flagellar basal body rod C-terminal domain-containing protein [Planctomycetota bacterium]